MATDTSEVPVDRERARWRLDPYLHVAEDHVFNPHADRALVRGEAGYETLRQLLASSAGQWKAESELAALRRDGWLIDSEDDPDRWYRLKYVSLEAHTVCNQACNFCPVSIAPRESLFMPMPLYERIVGELAELGEPIEGVFMISYNEPTIDPNFLAQVRCLKAAELPAAVLSNGTGLTPDCVDRLIAMGGVEFLSINLSTLDPARYRETRGVDHLGAVLRNLDYLRDRPVAPIMDMVVLGAGDDVHRRDYEAIRERFAGSPFNVKSFVVNDRAGYLQIGERGIGGGELCGCDHMGSRPIQHLHIDPEGKCFLCCQDYRETVIVGDLTESSVREVLVGDAFARARRQVYGLEQAPEDFICRSCRFALKR